MDSMAAAGNLAERIYEQAAAMRTAVRPETEMYLTIGAIINHTDIQDEYQAADHSKAVTYRLGRTSSGKVVGTLHSVAGEPAAAGAPVFEATHPAAQLLMARNFLQHLFAYFSESAELHILPIVHSADLYSTLASSATVLPPRALLPGGAMWGEAISGMRTRLSEVDTAASADTHPLLEPQEVTWDRRIARLTTALLPLVTTMIGGYDSICPEVCFGAAGAAAAAAPGADHARG